MNFQYYLDILKKEFVPALGCTEPVAVAFAVSRSREVLGCNPERVEVFVSGNIYKNGLGVGVPGTGMVGLDIAAALGIVGGKSEQGLEVLNDMSDNRLQKAKDYIESGNLNIDIKFDSPKLYIECISYAKGNKAKVIVQDRHTNIVLEEYNSKVIFELKDDTKASCNDSNQLMNLTDIYDFICSVDINELEFIEKGIKLNKAIAYEGLRGCYGLQLGKNLQDNINKSLLSSDLLTRCMMYTTAASDARMAGSTMPVMSNCGSGNQGLSVSIPVISVADDLKSSNHERRRAIALALLVSIYMKSFVGQLSALCGILMSTTGAACGITYLLKGNYTQIVKTINNMTGSLTGMICDGAKYGCSHKISSGVNAAVQSALLAMGDVSLGGTNGIIDDDVESTIRNIGRLAVEGMDVTDEVILRIMLEKQKKNK